MVEFSDLEDQNPWWSEPLVLQDEIKDLQKRERWQAVLKNHLKNNIILVGPRRSGKTSLMKLSMADLLEKGVDIKKIMYLTCDLIRDYEELKAHLDLFFEINKGQYVFLDEIQFVSEWYRTFKYFADKKKNIFATGSCSLIIEDVANSFLVDRHSRMKLLPMKFSEMMEVKEGLQSISLRISMKKFPSVFLSPENLYSVFEKFSERDRKKINIHFKRYLIEGGFPKTVFKEHRPEFYQHLLEEVFSKDLSGRTKKSWQDFLLFLEYLSQCEGVSSNINTIAKGTGMNYKTVKSMIHSLEELFIIISIPNCLKSRYKERRLERRKIYFQDRGLKTALIKKFSPRAALYRKSEDLSRDAEAVVVENLLRTPELDMCYFQESPTSQEIDIVARLGNQKIMIDVEWGGNYTLKKIVKKQKRCGAKTAIILTENELSAPENNIIKIPASLFLLAF